ncbi:MAG: DUF4339 domain-containing protein [Chthoniobacterales bacterium]|nr:DUF4339 domain-containing protein [Chthoniobacterales bacterium]
MPDEWFVRVDGKEYGPVDIKTLREWRAEGRLIPGNELRKTDETDWRDAAQFVEIFAEPRIPDAATNELFRRRTVFEIVRDSFGIYARGFLSFFCLALIAAVPSLVVKLALAFFNTPARENVNVQAMLPAACAMISFIALLLTWPVFLAGVQFATSDIVGGRAVSFRDVLQRAVNIWRRMATLSAVVYGSYIFWTVPLLVILSITRAEPSAILLLLTLLALAVQVYMVGRLFINFLFWQQSAAISGLDGVTALQESKELARSRREAPMFERPIFRGALLASLWLLVFLTLSVAIELPFLLIRIQGITSIEEATALVQKLVNAPAPDATTIATYVLNSLVHALLRPLLGISFVLLYFDAKARR